MRRTILLVITLCAACADILGVHDYTYIPDGDVMDAAPDAIADQGAEAGGDAEPGDAGCVLCVGAVTTPCALSCNEASPKWLAMDQARLYWANVAGPSELRTLIRPQGAPSTVTGGIQPAPNALAAVNGQILWTDGAFVRSAMLDGGLKTLVTMVGATSVAGSPVQQSPTVYWASSGNDAGIWRCGLPDCLGQILQIDQRNGPNGLSVVWDKSAVAPYGFWVDTGNAQRPLLGAIVFGGYVVQQYAVVPTSTGVTAADDKTHAYFAAFSAGASDVYMAGDTTPKFSATGAVRGLATALGDVWVTVDDLSMSQNGKVVKVLGGGGNVTVATKQDQPWGVVVDANYVYWTTLGGTVMRAGR